MKILPTLSALLLAAFGPIASAAESREDGTWEFQETLQTEAGESISVRIVVGPWDPSEHKLEKRQGTSWEVIPVPEPLDYSKPIGYRIDGRATTWGADGFGWPEREVKLFVVQWGHQIINVPRKHWRDYYGLLLYTLQETKKDSSKGGCWTKAEFDPASQELVIVANGGGGAGWYRATWKIKADGTIIDSATSISE